jgi:superfamily II DNA or RNA helicase
VSLPKRFRQHVPEPIRTFGASDYQSGHVVDISGVNYDIDAIIAAPKRDYVSLQRIERGIAYACTCETYNNYQTVCRHVWATLLAADHGGYLDGWMLDDHDRLYARDLVDLEVEPDELLGGPINERRIVTQSKPLARRPDWKTQLAQIRERGSQQPAPQTRVLAVGYELLYVIDMPGTLNGRGLCLELLSRERKKDGQLGKQRNWGIDPDNIDLLPDPADREILTLLHGAAAQSYGYPGWNSPSYRFHLRTAQLAPVIRPMCETGRCVLRFGDGADDRPMQWDDGPPWVFHLRIDHRPEDARYVVRGELRRGEEALPLAQPHMLVAGGLVFYGDHVARLDDQGAFGWISMLRRQNEVSVPDAHADELLEQLLDFPKLPPMQLPEGLRPLELHPEARPRFHFEQPRQGGHPRQRLRGHLSFDYDGTIISAQRITAGVYQPAQRQMIMRDADAEAQAAALLLSLGFKHAHDGPDQQYFELPPKKLASAVRQLTEQRWHVEASGKLYRQSGRVSIEVSSGIDWFELHGKADFDGQIVMLPQLLAALRKGGKTIVLGDGSLGVLPEQWLKQFGALAAMGEDEADHLKFAHTQVGLLDALLASQPEATCDEVFQLARKKVMDFAGIEAADPPPGFVGQLRPYQREGLGWMKFLRDFRFGGCLADDMGLGKTVQVLALLEERRASEPSTNGHGLSRGLSLVVAPRSLIFNWIEEAQRFSPNLRVLDHTGIARAKSAGAFAGYDMVLTTYGTLRNDIEMMKDIPFDYVILDEAQSIKNAASGSAKAVRLLAGTHRLALSGTPVQNHLGELWSLFEFLNPGMLGSARAFDAAGSGARVMEQETREVLARVLRPFILRRTKGQVAKELPQRIEQTIHCELDADQRKVYDELREHYRRSLLPQIEKEGINKSKIQILEALLRLRQAAIHPGLIDKSKVSQSSAKLDALLPQLAEVIDGNHKALVFSQFTSMLSIVRDRLDKQKIPYEYLDGQTRDRAARVKRFQTDDDCRLFLISLKAGGLGLNLTAAEYVFLLDPWWNPAVEAQAIDRAHRIGQSRQVFAYRLIAKDTVEEKVLQLQANKRELADAIINANNSVIATIGKDDLKLLLS